MYIFGLCYTTSIVVGIGMTFHRGETVLKVKVPPVRIENS